MGETHAQRRYIQDHCRNVLTSATYPFGKGDDKTTISRGATRKSFYLTVEQMTELYNCFLEKRYPEQLKALIALVKNS